MWQFIKRGLESLVTPFLKATWVAASKGKKPSPRMEWLGKYIWMAAGGYGLYNLYNSIRYGVVYRHARRGDSGWIGYADDPLNFVFWTCIYSLPVLVLTLLIWGYFGRRREAKRATLRHFSDGLRPAPIIQSVNDR